VITGIGITKTILSTSIYDKLAINKGLPFLPDMAKE
jgi:hypothetical protein